MELAWIWKAVIIVVAGTILLRIAGRKSISQMTLAQVVIMIGIGSLLIQPVAGKNIWLTLLVGLALVLSLIMVEYLQLKFDFIEKFVSSQAKVLVKDGNFIKKNMRKVRITVDQLETQLRWKNVSKISDVKWATLEPNGQVGFMLKEYAQPATKGEIQQIAKELRELRQLINTRLPNVTLITKKNKPIPSLPLNPNLVNPAPLDPSIYPYQEPPEQENLFSEVAKKGHVVPPPKQLQ